MRMTPYTKVLHRLLSCLLLMAAFGLSSSRVFAQFSPIPIFTIQSTGASTPFEGRYIDVVGRVTAIALQGFYLQDPGGDGDPASSDGIYVYLGKRPALRPGDCVLVQRGYASEFYGKTELSRVKALLPSDSCTGQVAPTKTELPRMYAAPALHFEPLEGMLVQVEKLAGIVNGPTKRYDGGDAEMALLPDPGMSFVSGGRIFNNEPGELTGLVYLSGAFGATLPDANWGDHVTVEDGGPVWGVIDFNFEKYQLILLPDIEVVVDRTANAPLVAATPTAKDELTVCTANLWGLGRGTVQYLDGRDYETQLGRRVQMLGSMLSGCTIIGLQETGQPADAAAVADGLRHAFGFDYSAWALPGPQTSNPEFPLTNAILTRNERVTVINAAQSQGCSPIEYDVLDQPGVCPVGQFPLHDRPPLVVDAEVTGDWGAPLRLRVITNHWKSKAGDEAVNAVRRTAQARQVAELVQQALDADPSTHVIVLGDLNDYYDSGPVQTLRTGVTPPMLHAFDLARPLDRYTYIFNGASQVLDHILLTSNLQPLLAEVFVGRANANFAEPTGQLLHSDIHHASDHDQVLVRLRPAGAATLGGSLGYGGMMVELVDADGAVVAETTTDESGALRLWNLSPGAYGLRLVAPPWLRPDRSALPLTLASGENQLPAMAVRHASVDTILGLARAAPELVRRSR